MSHANESLKDWPTDKPIILDNSTCVYCGTTLEADNTTREHVVGRKFVPKGTLDRQWSLIVQACRACNEAKADLEDDISAVTMQPDVLGRHASQDDLLIRESVRKAGGSVSRWTGKR